MTQALRVVVGLWISLVVMMWVRLVIFHPCHYYGCSGGQWLEIAVYTIGLVAALGSLVIVVWAEYPELLGREAQDGREEESGKELPRGEGE